ncbi:MAG: hypothetical protein ABIO72_00920 [Patescibacteria group bacterium]
MIGKNALTVVGVFVGIILALTLVVAFAVAKTGLVHVPVFSMFYHGPTPVRVVESAPITAREFQTLLTRQVASQLSAGQTQGTNIMLTEVQLTGALRDAIVQALRKEEATAEHVQIVVTPNYLEVSGQLKQRVITADLRVRLVPVIEDGGIRFDATDVQLGDYPIQPSLAHQLAGSVLSRDFGTWRISFGEIRFTSLTLKDGVLEIDATPNIP